DKWNTLNKKREQVAQKLRGKIGSTVELTINRAGKEMKISIIRQAIVIENQPTNLCDALDRMMKAEADTFTKIKGTMLNDPIEPNQPPNYEWESTLKLPRFSKVTIIKKYNGETYLQA